MRLKTGDLLRVICEIVIQKDGSTYSKLLADADVSSRWREGSSIIPIGTYCTYVNDDANDSDSVIVRRDLVGRCFTIRRCYVELVSSIDDAIESLEL
jgi:hypothetical protein